MPKTIGLLGCMESECLVCTTSFSRVAVPFSISMSSDGRDYFSASLPASNFFGLVNEHQDMVRRDRLRDVCAKRYLACTSFRQLFQEG